MDVDARDDHLPLGPSPLRAIESDDAEPKAGVFAALGLEPVDERVYRAVLARGRADIGQVVMVTNLPVGTVSRSVATLERLDLVVCDRGVLSALPPDVTIGRLVAQQREAMERAYHEAKLLASATQHVGPEGRTELDGQRAVASARWALVESAKRDLAWVGPAGIDVRSRAQANRQIRWIMARDDLADPLTCTAMETINSVGGQARVVSDLPFGLVIADGSRALLTASDDTHGVYSAGPPLIDLALSGFDLLWAAGAPIAGDESLTRDDGLAAADRQLLALLAAGTKDETAARHLRVSSRTVVRRVDRLMRELGADTRFQAGLYAARRGWL